MQLACSHNRTRVVGFKNQKQLNKATFDYLITSQIKYTDLTMYQIVKFENIIFDYLRIK